MRRYLFIALFFVVWIGNMGAEQLRSIGAPKVEEVRYPLLGLKAGYYGTIEYSYLHPIKVDNRLEVDFQSDAFDDTSYYQYNLRATYQWMFQYKKLPPHFNLFAGAGTGIISYNDSKGGAFGAGILGQFGIEYNFENLPIQLTLDYRPGYYFHAPQSLVLGDLKLAARYRF
jgi:hypothetical protein